MPLEPKFLEPGQYIRHFGKNINDPAGDPEVKFRFIRLQEREKPLRYPFKFASLALDAVATEKIFSDLDPAVDHLYEVFLGVSAGARYRIFHPFDERLLKWDINVADIPEDRTGVVTFEESPTVAPLFTIWIAPGKRYPAIAPQNNISELLSVPTTGRAITPFIIWVAARWLFEYVDEAKEPEIFDMLRKFKIPSEPVTFGHTLREPVR